MDENEVRADFEKWLAETPHRNLLDAWGSEYKRAFALQVWQAAAAHYHKAGMESERERCARIAEAEEELTTDPPKPVIAILEHERLSKKVDLMIAIVRTTKRNIAAAIREVSEK